MPENTGTEIWCETDPVVQVDQHIFDINVGVNVASLDGITTVLRVPIHRDAQTKVLRSDPGIIVDFLVGHGNPEQSSATANPGNLPTRVTVTRRKTA